MRKRLAQSSKMRKDRKLLIVIGITVFLLLFGRLIFEAVKLSPVLIQLLFSREIELKKTEQRVNVLILGIGGERHDGPLLTDTIIYASIDPTAKKVTLISLPRDLWVPDLKAKINTAYAFGEGKKKGDGLLLIKAVIESILRQPVDYIVRIDFKGFTKAIDMVGGVDVDVERGFEDNEYPIAGKEADACGLEGEEFQKRATDSAILEAFPCRFELVSFQKGQQHMDGITALKFVRSRHAKGEEGTDIARSKRQEKVIAAFKEKVFSLGTFLNPVKLVSLYDVFKDSIDTNIQQEEYDDFIKLFQAMKNAQMKSVVFFYDSSGGKGESLMVNPLPSETFDNQWVIIPRAGNGNFSEIQKYVACEIKTGNCAITPTATR